LAAILAPRARHAAPSPTLGAVLLLSIAVAAYLPALRAGFVWDDDYHVTHSPVLVDARGLARIWLDPAATPQYYPLTHTTFWIEHRLWGLAPLGYHLVNVLLHAGCGLLLWRVLLALEVPGALFAAAEYRSALELHPGDPDLLFGLANALARAGQPGEAVDRYEEGLRIRPDDASAHYDLGTLLARGGRLSLGIAHLQEAVRLRPDMTEARRNLEIARRLAAAAAAATA
jgi:tetratricopeptide (TPR) repeat protein